MKLKNVTVLQMFVNKNYLFAKIYFSDQTDDFPTYSIEF